MKRNIQVGIVGVAGSLVLLSGVAFAAEGAMAGEAMHSGSVMPSSMMMMHPPAPMILNISNDGVGRLRGVVTVVSTNSIMVATWGGVWTINIDVHTSMVPQSLSLSAIKVGDYVGAMGMISEDTPTMTATTLRDWSVTHDSMMMKTDHTMTGGDHMMSSSTSMKNDHTMMSGDHMISSSSAMMH